MNNLIDFIQEKLKISETSFMLEKLKINSKSKINKDNSDLTENIIDLLFLDERGNYDSNINDIKYNINNWINKNDVDFISVICTLDVLDGVLHDAKSSTIKLKDEYNNTHQNIKIKITEYDIIKEIRNRCIRRNEGKIIYKNKNNNFTLYSLDSIEPINILLYYSSMIGTIMFLKGNLEISKK